LLNGLDALDGFKRHAGLEFWVVSSAFCFHFACVCFGLQSAPTHHNHSLAPGPIFGVASIHTIPRPPALVLSRHRNLFDATSFGQ
jgi:hypothetical protein